MPQVFYFKDEAGRVPFLDWFYGLPEKTREPVSVRLERLAELGHLLRRPEADYLRDGLYELRVSRQGIHHRVLYFFHGRTAVVVTQGLEKESQVPDREIELALRRKTRFESDPQRHTHLKEGDQ